MRDLDEFLDSMAEQDDDHRAFANFLAEAKAEQSQMRAEMNRVLAQAKDHQVQCFALVRETVRKMADDGLTADQIADAVDHIFKQPRRPA